MEKRMFEELKKAYRPEFINRIDEKVVFHSLSSDNMQEVVKIMVKPLVASLAEKGIDLKLQASALKLLANQGYDQRWELVHFAELYKQKWKTSWQNFFSREN